MNDINNQNFCWQMYLTVSARARTKAGASRYKTATSFLKAPTTTNRHTISQTEKASYVDHINRHLGEDPFLKKHFPIDPNTDALFDLVKDGVLLWYFYWTCFTTLFFFLLKKKNSFGS